MLSSYTKLGRFIKQINMTINFDAKGKFFTNVISKVAVRARIQTTCQLIDGDVYIRDEYRLKDELDLDEPFLAVTDASVFSPDNHLLFHTEFLAVRRDQVIWVTTTDDIEKGHPDAN
jgi:hypothetical protein